MKRILVTGIGGSAGNNFVRSLRLVPEKFCIIGTDMSKYYIKLSKADKSYIVPHYSSEDYISVLNDIIRKEGVTFVHCQPDTELSVLSENRENVIAPMCLPSKKAIRTALNKLTLTRLLRASNVPAPYSFYINSYKDIRTAIDALFAKGNELFWVRAIKGAGSRAALPVKNYEQAKMWMDYWHSMKDVKYGQFMIAEFLPGKEYAFQSIWKDGLLVASQARQRLEYLFGSRLPSGQSSSPTIAKTVSNEDVNKIAVRAIKTLDPQPNGVYCVDLKEDKIGIPNVTEINAGRFFTTSIFFSQAGCNMPYYYVKLAFGEKIPNVAQYNPLPPNLYWIRQMDCQEVLTNDL